MSKRKLNGNTGFAAIIAAAGVFVFLYIAGFIAFWAGVIYLIWKLALS